MTEQPNHVDRFTDDLLKNPQAAPPPELDAGTAEATRALVQAERAAPLEDSRRARIWHKALLQAEQSDSFTGRAPDKRDRPQQNVTLLNPNEHVRMEDSEMYLSDTLEPMTRVAPGTRPPTPRSVWQYTLTLAAAVVILVLVGATLIDMAGEPIGGLPIFGVAQTEEPACVTDTVIDLNAESVRLAGEATTLMRDVPDRTPEMVEQAALLAICALRTAQTPQADKALQQALVLLDVVPQFPGHGEGSNSAVFSLDGGEVLIGGFDGVHVWDIATRSEVRTFSFPREVPGFRLSQAVFSPDGQYILAAANWNTGRLLNSETGEALRDFDAGIEITHLAYSPDNLRVALGLIDGSVQLWNVNTGVLEQTFRVHRDFVVGVAFSPDGASLLVGGERTQYEVYLVNLETGEQRAFVGLRDFSNGVAFSPDGQYVLAGGDTSDRRGVLWDTETGEQVHIFSGFVNDVNVVTFSPDGQYALLGSADRTARMFDVESGAEVRNFSQNDNYVTSVAFAPDGKRVLVGTVLLNGQGGDVRLWPTTIEDTVALACQHITRDFTPEERQQHGLGEGTPCPAA